MEIVLGILEIIGWGCMAAGSFFILSGAVGLLRMPDFFTRLHPAVMNDSAGLTLMLLGLLLLMPLGIISAKILLVILFSMITSSTAAHALAKAAIHSGVKPHLKEEERKDA